MPLCVLHSPLLSFLFMSAVAHSLRHQFILDVIPSSMLFVIASVWASGGMDRGSSAGSFGKSSRKPHRGTKKENPERREQPDHDRARNRGSSCGERKRKQKRADDRARGGVNAARGSRLSQPTTAAARSVKAQSKATRKGAGKAALPLVLRRLWARQCQRKTRVDRMLLVKSNQRGHVCKGAVRLCTKQNLSLAVQRPQGACGSGAAKGLCPQPQPPSVLWQARRRCAPLSHVRSCQAWCKPTPHNH